MGIFRKNYGFVEEATEANLNGKGEVWKRIQEWKPFCRYLRTDMISDKETGETKYTIDIVKAPKWVYEAIQRQLFWAHPERGIGKTYNVKVDGQTGQYKDITPVE